MTLKYPLDLNTSDVDWVSFTSHKYQSNASGVVGAPTGAAITLYMPTSTPAMRNENPHGSISFSGDLGIAVRDLSVAAAQGVGRAASGDIKGSVDKIVSQFGSTVQNQTGGAVQQLAVGAIAGASNMDANQLQALSSGQIYNPNIELLYKGPQLRGFSMGYVFAPKSADEAAAANAIIKEFKIRSSAALVSGSNMLKVPDIFQITYMSGGGVNRNMNQFKRAALVDLQVQANPGLPMHASFANGMPVLTKIQMSFTEVDVILQNDHTSSFSNIGY